ncbi:hypothetical protein BU25DRAFT_461270 [Macroventuria anomochaeta]|uniref:Uncharacterized protein n=1 Tax=Macroventuria anomochaeta TaxID=301207 RepID=A0ACB6RT10_9PLEO|nr:uncharacterized protein BU25DRAFT_461270 [Macroventuria anomochaeta]KAF2624417.1 hypothetical protein BU25DRAFT_461270 [Macroventuria anomochaeta]
MSSSRYNAAEKGKARALKPDLDTKASAGTSLVHRVLTPSRSRVPTEALQPTDTGSAPSSLPSLPTSPVQGARIPAGRRIPVRVTATATSGSSSSLAASSNIMLSMPASSPPVFIPSSAAEKSAKSSPAIHVPSSGSSSPSTETKMPDGSVADSMIKGFKYDPNDKTPPKRRMAAIADVVKTATADDTGLWSARLSSGSSSTRPQPLTQQPETDDNVAVMPVSALHTARLALMSGRCPVVQTRAPYVGEQGESSRSAQVRAATTDTQEPSNVVTSASILENSEASRTALNTALEQVNRICDGTRKSVDSIRKLPYALAKKQDPSHIEERLENATLGARLDDIGAKHTRLSIVTDRSSSLWANEDQSEAGISSFYIQASQKLQDTGASNAADPASEDIPAASPRSSYSSARESQNAFNSSETIKEPVAQDTITISPSTKEMPEDSPHTDSPGAIVMNNLHVSNSDGSYCDPPMETVPGRQCSSLPTIPERAVTSVPSGVSGIIAQEPEESLVEASRESYEETTATTTQQPPDPLPPIPAPSQTIEKKKTESTSYSSWILNWPSIWRIITMIILTLIPLAFLAASLYGIATTKTYSALPSDLFTTSSRTIPSEDGSSNLTISWVNGEAIGFQINPVYNIALDPNEPTPDALHFVFDWSVDTKGLLSREEMNVVSAMPIPSFGEEFVKGMALFGVFAGVYLLCQYVLELVSGCWHMREDENLYWTRKWLRWFDKAMNWVAFLMAAIVRLGLFWYASEVLLHC